MRETPKREYRLRLAKAWIKTYSGNNIVKGYSKKFAVDKLCAVMELRMSGVEIPEAYENQLRQSMEARIKHKCSMEKKWQEPLNASCEFESDENFAIIIGYTSGGYPYGVTHEEMEEIIQKQESE